MSQPQTDTGGGSGLLAVLMHASSVRAKVYLLAVYTGFNRLEDALYSVANPTASDARPGATHQDVVDAIRGIAQQHPTDSKVLDQLADDYAKEYCS